jgi:chromosome segregation ATPase
LSDEQDHLIEALRRERQAQADLAILVSQSNYDLGEVLRQFKDQATLIHGIASDVTWASQRFQTLDEILRSLQTGLKHVVDSQQASASQIAAATNRIEVAAGNFEKTVVALGQAANSLTNSTIQLAQVVSIQATGNFSQRG